MNIGFRSFNGEIDWAWVCEQVPILRVEDTGGLVAFDEDTGKLQAACMWDNWTKTTVQVHLIIVNKFVLKKGFLEEVADYLFNHCNRKAIYGFVPSDNIKALRLNSHLGYTVKAILEDGIDEGIDYIMLELKRENCKYLPKETSAVLEKNYG